jgi:hypothetical protein
MSLANMVYYQQQDSNTQDASFYDIRCHCASYEGLLGSGSTILTSAVRGVQQRDSAPPQVPIKQEAGWAPELILMICSIKNLFPLLRIEPRFRSCSAHTSLTVTTK